MKRNNLLVGLTVSGIALAGLTQSCVSDEPFGYGSGEGNLRMLLVVNSELTRAEINEENLLNSCVVYISDSKGLLYKYESAPEMPDVLPLKYGSYVAEAWAGDSVPASFDSRFYRGFQRFDINDNGLTTVRLECRIANVVVSVDKASITPEMLTDWTLRINNSTGDLTFDKNTFDDAKGYFMMSSKDVARNEAGEVLRDQKGWELYTNLYYTLEGTAADGSHFTTTGPIAGKNYPGNIVEHAHEYVLSFIYNPDYEAQGGSLIEIKIDDTMPEEHYEVGLYSRPSIKGVGFDIEQPIPGDFDQYLETVIRIGGFNGIKSIQVTSIDPEFGLEDGFDLMRLAGSQMQEVKNLGLDWEYTPKADTEASICYVHFKPDLLNRVDMRDTPYKINIKVEDGNGRINEAVVKLGGEVYPVMLDDVAETAASDKLAIRSNRATFTGRLFGVENETPYIIWRESGSSDDWNSVQIVTTRATEYYSVTLNGLKASTAYEVAVKCGDYQSDSQTFRTESEYSIPFGDMETWYLANNNSYIPFPGNNYETDYQFWDTGNHGSSAMSKTLTKKSSDIKHGGEYSAQLTSQYVGLGGSLGKFAAGNLFMGRFDSTVGMNGAKLAFGKPYDRSHPDAMEVWVHYTPEIVNYSENNALPKGQMDQGQIFVAFATAPAPLNTAAGSYFKPKASLANGDEYEILGYGEATLTSAMGSGNNMERLEIDIDWYENARTTEATTLIIVCSASKYGDYFTGGPSVMYVDDFKLLYK